MQQRFSRIRQSITDLAPTNLERAKLMKVHQRMVIWYLDGTNVPSIRVVLRAGLPCLLEALILDLQEIHAEMADIATCEV